MRQRTPRTAPASATPASGYASCPSALEPASTRPTICASKPTEAMTRNSRPLARPRSTRAGGQATCAAIAPSGSSGSSSSRAQTLPVPSGTTPRATSRSTSAGSMAASSPSPPAPKTASTPRATARWVASATQSRPSPAQSSAVQPASRKALKMRSIGARPPERERGLTRTMARGTRPQLTRASRAWVAGAAGSHRGVLGALVHQPRGRCGAGTPAPPGSGAPISPLPWPAHPTP
jgi:hypothetical protein